MTPSTFGLLERHLADFGAVCVRLFLHYPRAPPSLRRRVPTPTSPIPVAPSPRAPIPEPIPRPVFAVSICRRLRPPVKPPSHALTHVGLRVPRRRARVLMPASGTRTGAYSAQMPRSPLCTIYRCGRVPRNAGRDATAGQQQ